MKAPMTPPPSGIAAYLGPHLRRILAPNPSHMTLWGTNTYLLGSGEVALIDPGPDLDAHLDAILAALAPEERITHIFVTHSHADHTGLTARLKQATGAPVLSHPLAGTPDIALADGDIITGPDWRVEAIHTPGHIDDHFCFGWDKTCFTGDHVMGWSSSVIIPPRGDVGDYIASLDKLAARDWTVLHSAHGLPIDDPYERLAYLKRHRIAREYSVVKALNDGPTTLEALVSRLYATTPRALHGAATANIDAHLRHLIRQNRVVFDKAEALYSLPTKISDKNDKIMKTPLDTPERPS